MSILLHSLQPRKTYPASSCHTYYEPLHTTRLYVSGFWILMCLRPTFSPALPSPTLWCCSVILTVSMDNPQPPPIQPIVAQSLTHKKRFPRRTPDHASTGGSRSPPTFLPSTRHFLLPRADTSQLNECFHTAMDRQQTGLPSGASACIPRHRFLPSLPALPQAPAERAESSFTDDSDGDGDGVQVVRQKQKWRQQALRCTGQSAHFPARFSLGSHLK